MRIIAGEHRGRPLHANAGDMTRPITDRAKQSLFDALQDCFVGQTVLDCFAGSGSMGLECLSRGAAKVIFIERDRNALVALKQNIAELGLGEKAAILPVDAYALAADQSGGLTGPDFLPLTIAFVDPPYSHADDGHFRGKLDELLRGLANHAMVDGGIVSFRHPSKVSVDAAALGVKIVRELRYGEMGITWLAKATTKMNHG